MKSYVLGFLFTTDNKFVWLIRKNKPEWQNGKLNGIGGKIELNESPVDAMEREFKEEANIEIKSWKLFCTLTDDKNFEVYCYYTFSDLLPKTMTDEEVFCHNIFDLPQITIPNLRWLIPMALSFGNGESAKSFNVRENY